MEKKCADTPKYVLPNNIRAMTVLQEEGMWERTSKQKKYVGWWEAASKNLFSRIRNIGTGGGWVGR